MKIQIINENKSFLPEQYAYQDFIKNRGHDVVISNDYTYKSDIAWIFCGFPKKIKRKYIVHEFASLSTPPFSNAKDVIKKLFMPKPNYRIYLNNFIKDKLDFNNDLKYDIRDMGVSDLFFNVQKTRMEYDWVYLGEMKRLELFWKNLISLAQTGQKILLIGQPTLFLIEKIKMYDNVSVTGRVPYETVPFLLSNCKYGLNFMPLISPYIYQTSTKVLEYSAVGLTVISQNYQWVSKLKNSHSGLHLIDKWPCQPKEWLDLYEKAMNIHNDRSEWAKYKWGNILLKMKIWDELGI